MQKNTGVHSHTPLPDAAMQELVSVLHPDEASGNFAGNVGELWEVFRHIGRAEKLSLPQTPVLSPEASLQDSIRRLGKLGHCHLRKVRIREAEAWQQDMGSLIGFVSESQRPCALLFKGKGYHIQFAGDARSQPLSKAQAEALEDCVYVCYPELDESPIGPGKLLQFMFRGMAPDLWRILWLRLGLGLSAVVLPIISGFIFEEVIPQRDTSMLAQVTLALFLNLLIASLFGLSQFLGILRLRLKINQRLQAALWLRLLRLPQHFFKRWEAGDLSLRVSAVDQIQQILSNASLNVVLSALIATINLILVFYYSARIGAYISFFALLLTLIIALVTWFRYYYLKQIWELRGRLASRILQIINNISKIRLANIAVPVFQRWVRVFAEKSRHNYRIGRISNAFVLLGLGFGALSTITLYTLVFLEQERISFGDFIVINGLVSLFFTSYTQFIGILSQVIQVMPVYQRAKPILQTTPELRDKGLPHRVQGELELRHLSFQYEEMDDLLLKDISVTVKPGEMVGIIGASGSGKTTLLRLITALETPQSGEIFFDGTPLRQIDAGDLRRQIGFVMQDTKLFPGSIADNIRGHCHQASMDEIRKAANKACLAEEIEAMPMQYHTLLTNSGESLSSGQRQRIQLAHVFLARPRLLLLDEATSALDNVTRTAIQEALRSLQITQIIISHRPSSLREVQRIYKLEDGALREVLGELSGKG